MFSRETLLRLRGTRAGLAHDDFLGKAQIGLGAFGLDVVMKDGLAEAGGLGKPHGAGDDRFKDLIGEATVHFVMHLPRQAVAPSHLHLASAYANTMLLEWFRLFRSRL